MFPRLFEIGNFSLPTYGALVAIAFLTALWLTTRFAKERGVNSEKVVNLGVYCALVGMLGAKVMMIAMDPEYRVHPAEIFTRETLQSAGIFYGGFVAALLFAYFYMRRQKLAVLPTADLFAPGVAIGHGIGRLGCFAAGCCLGQANVIALGRDVYQQGYDDRRAAGCAAASDSALRGAGGRDHLFGVDMAIEAGASGWRSYRIVSAALRDGEICGGVPAHP